MASASISFTIRFVMAGAARRLPRASAALPAHGAVGIDLILDADEAHAEMVEFFERRQQMARAAREAVEFPDQHAVDLAVSGRRHQGAELGAALPTA